MENDDLVEKMDGSICLSLYTDPVSLRCGHNFCRSCIVNALDAQEAVGGYSCPDCRAEYPQRPALEKNRKLGNIVERFLSTQPDMEETRVFCTYCTKSQVPAVRSCLQCENSLCDDHLTAHNKTMDHMLTEPVGSFCNNKCPLHKKVLEYYCPRDASCLCVSCCLVGEHWGHKVELLDEASEKKKKKLRKYLEKLNPQKEEIPTRVQNLLDHKAKIQEKASDKRKNVSKIFMDMKEQLEIAERKTLNEISRQEEEIVSQISDQIKKLETQEDELCRKMRDIEEMCRITDPIRLLQESDITGCGDDDEEDIGEAFGRISSDDGENAAPASEQAHVSPANLQDIGTDSKNVRPNYPFSYLLEIDDDVDDPDDDLYYPDYSGDEEPHDDLEELGDDPDESGNHQDELDDEPDDPVNDQDGDDVEELDELGNDGEGYDTEESDDDPDQSDDDLEELDDDLCVIASDLDDILISLTLYQSVRDIVTNVTSELEFSVPDILLDERTAHRYVEVSEDLKIATDSGERNRPESAGLFQTYRQVLSRCDLSSGRHYWEVEWDEMGDCDIGVSYSSIKRDGDESGSGDNEKSWCLNLDHVEYTVLHNSAKTNLPLKPKCPALGVFLDYEAGLLSFYELCDPIRHLYTFTASFTEPLHAIFYVYDGASVAITS
ncbi:E3 ubiquitin/ISG15 ligase TRIM25-like isoform X2 [Engystomops pustulosus]